MLGSSFTSEGQAVPGDPEELFLLASQLRAMAQGLSEVAAEIAEIGADGWRGPAADAFESLLAGQPGQYRQASAAFFGAATSVVAYAEALASAQQVAAGPAGLAAARSAVPAGRTSDAGAPVSTAADAGPDGWIPWRLDAAHQDLALAARAAVQALRAHGDVAAYGTAGCVALSHPWCAAGEQVQFALTPSEGPMVWQGWTHDPLRAVEEIVPALAEARYR